MTSDSVSGTFFDNKPNDQRLIATAIIKQTEIHLIFVFMSKYELMISERMTLTHW